MMDILINIVTTLLIATLTSYLTVHFSLKRYRSEKLWDKRAQCYCEIVDALNSIIRHCDAFISEKFDGKNISENEKRQLSKKFYEGKAFLETQTNIGRLLISSVALDKLLILDRELYKAECEEDLKLRIPNIRVATEDCLYAFIPIARKALGTSFE